MSHRWTSAFDDHLDHCFIVLNNVQQSIMVRQFFVLKQLSSDVGGFNFGFWGCFTYCTRTEPGFSGLEDEIDGECHTSITRFHGCRAEMPSMRKPASKDMTPDSVELCDTVVCFLHVQVMGPPDWNKGSTFQDLRQKSS